MAVVGNPSRRRMRMVRDQLERRGVEDGRLLQAMRTVPRERFVPDDLAAFAYDDTALPIEAGQTISQPYIVGRMIELATIGPDDVVLEVGAGSGYAAAVMSRIARHVFAIERHAILAAKARQRLATLGYDNVTIICRDGSKGLPDNAPFDAIVVSARAECVPEPLYSQIKLGGRLVIPVGPPNDQELKRIHRVGENSYAEEDHGGVAFVPLVRE